MIIILVTDVVIPICATGVTYYLVDRKKRVADAEREDVLRALQRIETLSKDYWSGGLEDGQKAFIEAEIKSSLRTIRRSLSNLSSRILFGISTFGNIDYLNLSQAASGAPFESVIVDRDADRYREVLDACDNFRRAVRNNCLN